MYFENEKDILGDISADNDLISWDDVLAKEEEKPSKQKQASKDGVVNLKDEISFDSIDDEPIDEEALKKILNDDTTYSEQASYNSYEAASASTVNEIDPVSVQEDALNQSLSAEMNKRIPNDFVPRKEQQAKGSNVMPLLILALLLLLIGGGYYGITFYLEENDMSLEDLFNPQNNQQQVSQVADIPQENVQTEDIASEQEENIPVVNEDEAQEIVPEDEANKAEEKTKVVQVYNSGRVNPFQPIGKYLTITVPKTTLNYDGSGVPKPPEEYGIENENTRKMVTITVSGVMYDSKEPSAIITYDKDDYFVQKGDKLDEFDILDIGKGFVIIGLGKNTYKANIGENFQVDIDIDGSAKFLPEGQGRQYYSSNHTSTSDVAIRTRN